MRKISVAYGKFPEILPLNSNFRPGCRLLKVVLEVQKEDIQRLGNFVETYQKLVKLFPSIRRHGCCQHSLHPEKTSSRRGIPIKEADLYANIAHLTEHVIMDLIANTSGPNSVSGLTCGYLEPINRHDIFVECPRRELGFFAANLALEVMERLGKAAVQMNRVKRLMRVARMIQNSHSSKLTTNQIGSNLGLSPDQAQKLLEDYRRLSKEKGR